MHRPKLVVHGFVPERIELVRAVVHGDGYSIFDN
jgi:hypothetical protein